MMFYLFVGEIHITSVENMNIICFALLFFGTRTALFLKYLSFKNNLILSYYTDWRKVYMIASFILRLIQTF